MWSTHYWYTLFSIVNEISKEKEPDEENVKSIIYGICLYVPCAKCKEHFKTYIKEHPLDVKNLKRWLSDYRQNTKPIVRARKGCCGKSKLKETKVTNTKRIQGLRNF